MRKFQIAGWSAGFALLVALGAGTLAGSLATARVRKVPVLLAAKASGGVSMVSFTDGFAPVVQAAVPAVVNVSSSKIIHNPGANVNSPFYSDPFFRQFFGNEFPKQFEIPPSAEREQSLGSGVIVNADGYILTNNHVLNGAKDVKVLLRDKREFNAHIVGTDAKTDVAVLKVDAHNLPVLSFGDSSKLQPGNFVLAIGSPFGLNQTVTMGIVSATGRAGLGIEDYEDFIQTDAAINPGNSGGALIDSQGDLIGINTAILSSGGGNQGVGFAVPGNLVRNVMDQILKSGKVTRAWLGVSVQTVTQDIAKAFHLSETYGALVNSVSPDSPAAKAGVETGDIILDINGEGIEDDSALQLKIGAMTPGTQIKLTVFRNGAMRDLSVTLGGAPGENQPAAPSGEGAVTSTHRGISAAELTSSEATQLKLPANTKGVLITSVDPASSAAAAGLQQGDVIEEVNRKPVSNVAEFNREMQAAGAQPALLLIARNGVTAYRVVEAQ